MSGTDGRLAVRMFYALDQGENQRENQGGRKCMIKLRPVTDVKKTLELVERVAGGVNCTVSLWVFVFRTWQRHNTSSRINC